MDYETRRLLKQAISALTSARIQREIDVERTDEVWLKMQARKVRYREKNREAILERDRNRKRKQRPKAA